VNNLIYGNADKKKKGKKTHSDTVTQPHTQSYTHNLNT